MEKYRIVINVDGRWRVGKIAYPSMQEANERRQYFIDKGTAARDIKISAESELFN